MGWIALSIAPRADPAGLAPAGAAALVDPESQYPNRDARIAGAFIDLG